MQSLTFTALFCKPQADARKTLSKQTGQEWSVSLVHTEPSPGGSRVHLHREGKVFRQRTDRYANECTPTIEPQMDLYHHTGPGNSLLKGSENTGTLIPCLSVSPPSDHLDWVKKSSSETTLNS